MNELLEDSLREYFIYSKNILTLPEYTLITACDARRICRFIRRVICVHPRYSLSILVTHISELRRINRQINRQMRRASQALLWIY